MKKCPYCGAIIEENARFCLYCMKELEEKVTRPEETILPDKTQEQTAFVSGNIAADYPVAANAFSLSESVGRQSRPFFSECHAIANRCDWQQP